MRLHRRTLLSPRVRWHTTINDDLQLGRNRHALEHADVTAARVPDWDNPDGRTKHAQNDAHDLAEGRRGPLSPQLHLQHQPVRFEMRHDKGLAYDVSALQVGKAFFKFTSRDALLR